MGPVAFYTLLTAPIGFRCRFVLRYCTITPPGAPFCHCTQTSECKRNAVAKTDEGRKQTRREAVKPVQESSREETRCFQVLRSAFSVSFRVQKMTMKADDSPLAAQSSLVRRTQGERATREGYNSTVRHAARAVRPDVAHSEGLGRR